MTTINISLPTQLKGQADLLVSQGYYASFSDLARTALRQIISQEKLNLWLKQTKNNEVKNKAVILNSDQDVDLFFK
jgi:Arc/MetJ-type ribon-helix-helix transcriptional regulator